MAAWHQLAARLKAHYVTFAEEPHQRLTGRVGQHLTMFIFAPFGNALESKSFDDQGEAFLTGAGARAIVSPEANSRPAEASSRGAPLRCEIFAAQRVVKGYAEGSVVGLADVI